ncbi:MAG TPA: protein-glutamate O-methyltransferase CheR [Candidatus Kapabacteria bacterium]|nr:protein-glutamate O-methyltransferase CheR [Candidatus Kapabacteria bacterium]HPO62365.1 protein-glutamate O-methyltransferase CheR [Candidatus Kapabacteria bacterium]
MSDLFKFPFSKQEETVRIPFQTKTADYQIQMTDEDFQQIRDIIYQQSGIYYSESKKYLLESRIAKRLVANNLTNYHDYIKILLSFNNRVELNSLFQVITINETYFFRAEQQFEVFERVIAPELIKLKQSVSNPIFRIWSAASSTGEEAYTIALLVLEKLKPNNPNVHFQILGTDINNAVLDAARQGLYKDYAIRNVPAYYLNKYFKKEGINYRINDEVKKLVRFMNINLFDTQQMRTITGCDVVFCCNVLIYFDLNSKQKVISSLYDSLNKDGYLFIGYSESLHGVSKAFKLIHLPKAMAYKKE